MMTFSVGHASCVTLLVIGVLVFCGCNAATRADKVAEGFSSLAVCARGVRTTDLAPFQEDAGPSPTNTWSFYCDEVSFVGGAELRIALDPITGGFALDQQEWELGAPLCDDSTLSATAAATAIDGTTARWKAKGKLLKKGGKDCDFDFTAVFSTETGVASSVSGTLCGRDIEKYDLD